MIPELKETIDKKIKELMPEEENVWMIYKACKKIVRKYERLSKVRFSFNKYNEYIKYITDTLQI